MAKRKPKKAVAPNKAADAEPVAADAAEAEVVDPPHTPPVDLVPVESKTATLSASAIRRDGGDPGLLGFDTSATDDTIDIEDDQPIDPGPAPVVNAKIPRTAKVAKVAKTTKARRVGNGKGRNK